MQRIDKIKALEQVFKTSTVSALNKISQPIGGCTINLSDGTFTVMDGITHLIGKKLSYEQFNEAIKGREVKPILNLGNGIKPT